MAIIATVGANDGQSFTPAPAGVHQAVCVDIVDLGIVEVTWQGKTKQQHKINVAWQIDEPRDDGKPYLVFKRYTLSLSEKANLRKDLESWRGKKFTRDEEMGFDVESVLGANCLLNIQHNTNGDKTYANVVSIMPLVKGMGKLSVRDFVRKQDRQPDDSAQTNGHNHEDGGASPLTEDDIPFARMGNY